MKFGSTESLGLAVIIGIVVGTVVALIGHAVGISSAVSGGITGLIVGVTFDEVSPAHLPDLGLIPEGAARRGQVGRGIVSGAELCGLT
jgi:hypothetical protein